MSDINQREHDAIVADYEVEIADLKRKGEQLCQQNGELLMERIDTRKVLESARAVLLDVVYGKREAAAVLGVLREIDALRKEQP